MNLMRPAGDRLRQIGRWLDDTDPGGRRRVRGLRLVASFAMASMAGMLAMPGPGSLAASACAGNFAIWACVYEAAATRTQACVDLLALIAAAALGSAVAALWSGLAGSSDSAIAMLPLVAGAFLVDYAKRYGTLATGAASMAFIGQAIGLGLGLTDGDLPMIGATALLGLAAAAGLRVLAGASERDADALSRCRDFRRILANRLRRYHDALHPAGDAALIRIVPQTAELSTAWAALDALVRSEFTNRDLIAGYVHGQLKRLYAQMQAVQAIGDALPDLLAKAPGLGDRAAVGLVLHTLRRTVLMEQTDAALAAQLEVRCERVIRRAAAAQDLPIEARIALLRIGLATRHDTAAATPEASAEAAPAAAPAGGMLATTRVAFQAGLSALAIILLSGVLGLDQELWALAASTYVISSSVADTWSRGIRRIVGTAVGVALGLGMALPFAHMPVVVWPLAALAMVIYSVWMPLRYDVACGAYAFALVITLAEAGQSSWGAASARGLDTVIGAAIGMAFSALVLPVRLRDQLADMLAALLTRARDQAAVSLAWAGGAAAQAPAAGGAMLAEVEAQKTRFAGLRFEGILTRDGDSGALLLLRIDAVVETTIRLMEESRLAREHADPGLRGGTAGLEAQLRLAFDTVLARLHRQGRPPLPPSDAVLPPLGAYMAAAGTAPDAATDVLLAAALTYTCRKIIRILADIAAELDRRDGVIAQPIAR
jgi:uncharacterized membrane protein YccC